MPALPLDEAGKYVAGAYVVFLTLILVYVAIIGSKIARIEQQIEELLDVAEEDVASEGGRSPTVQASRDGEQFTQDAGLEAPRR